MEAGIYTIIDGQQVYIQLLMDSRYRDRFEILCIIRFFASVSSPIILVILLIHLRTVIITMIKEERSVTRVGLTSRRRRYSSLLVLLATMDVWVG